MSAYEEYEPDRPLGWSPLVVAVIATLVLLLGLGGALFGIHVANQNAAALGVGTPTPTPPATSNPVTTPTATAGPTETGSAGPTASPTATGEAAFPLPDLAGLTFQAARQKVRELKLGWRLQFGSAGTDPTVHGSDPPANAAVTKGVTVKILVSGAAPLVSVPDIRNQPCAQAADAIIEAGLYPHYDTSARAGTVVTQLPLASDPQTLRWNDELHLLCSAEH